MTRRARRSVQPPDSRRRNGPLVVVRPDPQVWAAALQEAGGDARRLRVQPDGSVIVLNAGRRADPRARWTP